MHIKVVFGFMKMLFTKILFSINVFENYGNSQSVNTLSKY